MPTSGRGHPDLRLIVITDARLAAPRSLDSVVAAALEAGAPALQLRDKDATPADLYAQAVACRERTRRTGALLFVNDRLDIALAAGADGVHLGPDDLPVRAALAALARARASTTAQPSGPRPFFIGFSTDDPATARAAEAAGADYIGCGAVFGTTSKAGAGDERIGTEQLADVVRAVRIPVVGIGGVTPDNAHQVAAAGAAGVAVIGTVMGASDVHAIVQALLQPFGPGRAR